MQKSNSFGRVSKDMFMQSWDNTHTVSLELYQLLLRFAMSSLLSLRNLREFYQRLYLDLFYNLCTEFLAQYCSGAR